MKLAHNHPLAELLRFGCVGVINTAIDVSVFFLCVRVIALPLVAANFSSWIVAFSFSFLVNNAWTFRRQPSDFLKLGYYLRIAAGNLVSWSVATGVLLYAAPLMPLFAAKLASIAVGFVLNFAIAKYSPVTL